MFNLNNQQLIKITMSKEKGEKNKGGKIEETSQVVALDGDPRTNVDCYVVVKEHDNNSDSLVDCCGLVGCVSDNARSNSWLLGGEGLERRSPGRIIPAKKPLRREEE